MQLATPKILSPDVLQSADFVRCSWFLDFDGTLAPIVARPSEARLEPATFALLRRLSIVAEGAVAILSGRSFSDVAGRVPADCLVIVGSHGAESASGEVSASDRALLDGAVAELEARSWSEGVLLERKAAGVALHYRARPEMGRECRDAVDALANRDPALRAVHGKMVSELCLAGHDKGTALRALMDRPPFRGRTPVMIGDDTTDEDGFQAARDLGGVGIRIGEGPTAASWRFDSVEEFLTWLTRIVENG